MPAPTPSTQEGSKRTSSSQASNSLSSKGPSPPRSGSSTTAPTNNTSRTKSARSTMGSPMSARSALRKPPTTLSKESSADQDEARAETLSLVDELRSQLRKAESASEDYQKEITILQSRLDDALEEQNRLEESSQNYHHRIEDLQKVSQQAERRQRELQTTIDQEKTASLREREEAATREDELNASIQKLRERLSGRAQVGNLEGPDSQKATDPQSPSPLNSQDEEKQKDTSELILQKDKVIDALRLELAEAQIKLVEVENHGGGQAQNLEKMLLEARMSNAKLLEDNESYQMLLSEKTLNGELTRSGLFDTPPIHSETSVSTPSNVQKTGGSSLAEELEGVDEKDNDGVSSHLEAELTAAKEQNRALTLYINKIISRLLATESFEKLFESGSLMSTNPLSQAKTARSLGPYIEPTSETAEIRNKDSEAPSLLQRAGSLFGSRQRPRPVSFNPTSKTEFNEKIGANQLRSMPEGTNINHSSSQHLAAPTEDPTLAPSVPIRRSHSGRGGHARGMSRGHRRATSEWSGSANTLNSIPRVQDKGTASSMVSPKLTTIRQSTSSRVGSPPPLSLEGRILTGEEENLVSGRNIGSGGIESSSATAKEPGSESDKGENLDKGDIDDSESSRAAAAAALEGKVAESKANDRQAISGPGGGGWFSGQPTAQKRMRPLRLVQEKAEAEEAAQAERKKANRGSIMTWFSKGATPSTQGNQAPQGTSFRPALMAQSPSTDPVADIRPATAGDQRGS